MDAQQPTSMTTTPEGEPQAPVGQVDPAPVEAPQSVSPDAPAVPLSPARRPFLHALNLLFLLLLGLAVLLPGISSLPLTDRDEALYVQASKQMIETGNWIDIRFQEEPRYKKPVGIYWLQGLSALATGQGADAPLWAYRVPSIVGALLVVLFTYGLGAQFGGARLGLIAGLFAATALSLNIEARIAKTDAMLAATILAAQFALASAYLDPQRRRLFWRNALFWTAMGLGALIKGPITPLVSGLTILTLSLIERRRSLWLSLSPLKGIGWMLLLVLPWLLAIGWISGGAFFSESLGKDMMGKVAGAQESHGAPPGTYLLASLGLFWPLIAFAPIGLGHAWRHRAEPLTRFAAAWVIPVWLLFEAVPTKLPNYILPLMPAVALIVATGLIRTDFATLGRLQRWLFAYIPIVAVLLGLGLNGGFVYVQGRADLIGLGLGVAAGAAGVGCWWLLSRGRLVPALGVLALTTALIYGLAFERLLPAATELWLSDDLAAALAEVKPCPAPEVIVVGYREPSVVFRLGTRVQLPDAIGGANAFTGAACAVAFVNVDRSTDFLAALAAASPGAAAPVPVRLVEARNLNAFKFRSMQVFVKGG
ncbi:ArnT family glycosyltransferase [Oryzibacter oryziterrae]|uniref:ArnT family glycosyltransferase n=1 Tax=Oryzibacter oryziterrae TaxID=2766474 RepID=UPI001F358340|nr:glycosyltransferase family 39 protein [Oryzibacter oryziterrae]